MEEGLASLESRTRELRPVVPLFLALLVSLGLAALAVGPLIGSASRIEPLQMPAPPSETGFVPPIAVLEDIVALSSFVRSSLDDVVEDAAKISCVVLVYVLSGAAAVVPPSGSLRPLVQMTAVALSYLPCDCAADYLGDEIQRDVNDILPAIGLAVEHQEAPPLRHPAANAGMPLPLRLVDDVTEDSFKLMCLWSHAQIGELLSKNLARAPYLRHFRWLVYLGVPAARYNACNMYGDFLGDWVQHSIQRLLWAEQAQAHTSADSGRPDSGSKCAEHVETKDGNREETESHGTEYSLAL